jgi:hypothetical protein
MAQKMTLTAYLAQRGVKAKALTKGEADLLGIPYPLQGGWPRKYGTLEINEELLKQLVVYAEAARQVAEEKARRSQIKPTAAEAAGAQLPLVGAPARIAASPVPGFVLRQARRYRQRSSAPGRKKARARRAGRHYSPCYSRPVTTRPGW